MSEAIQPAGAQSGVIHSEGGMDFLVTRQRRLVTVYADRKSTRLNSSHG